MRVLLVSANREILPSPVVPIGVLAVAGAARAAGHEVAVVDLCFESAPCDALRAAIRSFSPDVVGLGIRNLHTNAYDGEERLFAEYAQIAKAIRSATGVPLVLGGAGFSLRPETLLHALAADHGVVGEGERAFVELLDAIRGGNAPRTLASTPPRRAIVSLGKTAASDLDLLPPVARDLVDPRYFAFDGVDAIQTKRGCAFSCAYCDYPDLEGRKVRLRDPARVADEIADRARDGRVSHLFFVDSVFNVPRSHALAVCREIEARGSPLPWVAYVTPAALDDDIVSAMARAGCIGVEIGTDAGTDAMLRRLDKPFALDDVRRARELFARYRIHDCHTFVLGFDGESPREVESTLRFVDELGPDVAVFIAFMEDRETRTVERARHRADILALLAREAPRRPGWVVPELGIRFHERIVRLLARGKRRGPSWLHLAAQRSARAAE